MIRILLIDDHEIVRRGLKSLIESSGDMKVTGEACDALEALRIFDNEIIDVAVLDISLGYINGIQLAEKIRNKYPEVKIVILSMHADRNHVLRAFSAGAIGYVAKQEASEQIIKAIRTVSEGKHYLSLNLRRELDDNIPQTDFIENSY